MKRIVKTVVFLLLLSNAYAQQLSNNYNNKIDSLQSLLSLKNHDTTRLMLLHSLAQVYAYNLQISKSVETLHTAQELNKKLKFPKGYSAEYRTITCLMYSPHASYFDNYAKWGFKKLQQKDNFPALNLSYPELGEKENIKFLQIRIQQLKEGFAYAKKVNNNKLVAVMYDNLAANNMLLYNYNQAIIYADSTHDAWKQLNETALSIYPILMKNWCYTMLGNSIKAKEVEIQSNTMLANLDNLREKMILMTEMSNKYHSQERYALSVEYSLKALEASVFFKDTSQQIENYLYLGSNYSRMSMSKKVIDNYKKAIDLYEKSKIDNDFILNTYYDIRHTYYDLGFEFADLKEYELAKKYFASGDSLFQLSKNKDVLNNGLFLKFKSEGAILMGLGNFETAIVKFLEAGKYVKDSIYALNNINYRIAYCYQKSGNLKSSLLYGEKSYNGSLYDKKQLIETTKLLAEVYEQNNQPLKAFGYLKKHDKILSDNAAENITNNIADAEIKAIIEKSDQEKQQLEQERAQKIRESNTQRWLIFSIAMALLSTLVILYILSRNNRQKQAANQVLEQTLTNLKSTQSQLIQSEKMASLGELTAGIAHEIQNPLNFVNNFSEVNTELIDEAGEEMNKGNISEAKIILNDIKENEQKINHHGKRADAIVKGMLQHSQSSTGKKEPTNINALTDEYLRLSYHGLRAKDNSFNATLKTDFDETIGSINIIPQDIGRVLLNLYNNAFYAVHEKKKQQPEGYEPTVSISTKKTAAKVEIAVGDNGNGIPKKVLDKIFQPFFTTKPTGQGTGLGLSLSYDIIKTHGGEIKVNTIENDQTEFIITLPIA
jgi:two-component system, NtrC family, sensor kinase